MFASLFSPPLPVGSDAPDFSLPDQEGHIVRLPEARGKNVVLIFYPGDNTPVCRKQLCEFRDNWEISKRSNTVVFGINPQSASSHEKFRVRQSLPFPLLVDAGQSVARLYKAGGLFIRRTVYLIGVDGKIRFARRGKPTVGEVLAAAAP